MIADKQPSIYWYDFETFGANPQKDRPCQFAGIRTDLDLNIIGEPLILFCRPAPDTLPHPEACLVTGITPQKALKEGVNEAEFIKRIHNEFSCPNTCVAGFNSIRFDDEVTRYTLYRNFYDPYAREWQNGNSRWDVIDMVRACYALRPQGINWPRKEDGSPSFKLEDLTKANGIEHDNAHDALSDVIATIELAKIIKFAQPKLYHFLFNLRFKKAVAEQFDVFNMTPLVHTSSMFPAVQGCTTWVAPISFHPVNKNAVICADLTQDVSPLIELSIEEIHQRLYTSRANLTEDELPVGLKLIHINKCPVVAPAKTLLPENAQRLGIDRQACLDNLARLKAAPDIREKITQVYEIKGESKQSENPDYQLYAGFTSHADKHKFDIIRRTSAEALGHLTLDFEDKKFDTLLFRYRARNWPETLSPSELDSWRKYCQCKLIQGEDQPSITVDDFMLSLESLAYQYEGNQEKTSILQALYHYAQNI